MGTFWVKNTQKITCLIKIAILGLTCIFVFKFFGFRSPHLGHSSHFLYLVKLTSLFTVLVSSRYQCDHNSPVWLHCQYEGTVATGRQLQRGHQTHHEERWRWCPSHLLLTRSSKLIHLIKICCYISTTIQTIFLRLLIKPRLHLLD